MMKRLLILCMSLLMVMTITAQQELMVGGRARVYVEDPTGLRMRSGPGVNNALVENLFTGDIVDIIGGPTSNGGYIWWNIRAPSGNTGWSVESADNIQTLIPLPPVTSEEPLLVIELEFDAIVFMRWSPDDTMLALTQPFGNGIQVFDTETGDPIMAFDQLFVETFEWSADSQYLQLSNSFEESTMIMDIETVDFVVPDDSFTWVTSDNTRVRVSDFSIGDNIDDLVIQQETGILRGGQIATYEGEHGEWQLGDATGGITWERNSPLVVIWSMARYPELEGITEVWNIETGELLLRVPHNAINGGISASISYPPALSMDGTRLATVTTLEDFNSEIHIWETDFTGTIGEKSA